MRFGTLVFLGLFGAFVWYQRAPDHCAPWIRMARASPACELVAPVRNNERVRQLQSELDRLERKGRDLERSLQSVSQSERTLRQLADRHGDAAVRAELADICTGVQRLRELRDRTEVERVAVSARLQLARAGLDEDGRDWREWQEAPAPRASPVDALSGVERESRRVTSRAR